MVPIKCQQCRYLNKTFTMVTQVDMSMSTCQCGHGKFTRYLPPVDEELQTINRGRDDTPPQWLISSKWSALNMHTYEQHYSDSAIIKEDIRNLRENLNGT